MSLDFDKEVTLKLWFLRLQLDHIVGYEPMAHGVNGMEKERGTLVSWDDALQKNSYQIQVGSFSYSAEEYYLHLYFRI